ncbi:hypothetical protein [Acinetobacter thermotolerans]|uniref:hypothetical protein n=1 Tax=Acinetobacter thermotolerans TaxID=3151487 RepID=UPI00325B5B11
MTKKNLREKLELIEKQKAEQLKKLAQLKEQEKTLKAQQRKQQRDLSRQQETRLKILIGAYFLRKIKENPNFLQSFKADFINFASEPGGKAAEQNVTVLEEFLKEFE